MPARLTPDDVDFVALRAQGPGGQNVNKVSSAVQLRFDVAASALPDWLKTRLLALADRRLNQDGVIVIKAQTERSQERNKAEALARLQALVDAASHVPAVRRATQPTRASQRRRLEAKTQRAGIKALRGRVAE
ncbi:alternative ribosome rescue aminoacyl-tRNA hydrolase ArfB [Roseateles sp. DB2]|uniref:alternative ribosome rescue aminoacyl-tRNA hydrolase ArfB n=1 Tax=Roseateles sp. DB2 TaxID=3453717 RepID=UPI003EE8E002